MSRFRVCIMSRFRVFITLHFRVFIMSRFRVSITRHAHLAGSLLFGFLDGDGQVALPLPPLLRPSLPVRSLPSLQKKLSFLIAALQLSCLTSSCHGAIQF